MQNDKTFLEKEPVRRLLFRLAGYADSLFMGVIPEELAFLERTVDEARPGNQV